MTERLQMAASVLAGTWIVITMVFYCVRFSMVMYNAHQADINAFFARIGAWVGTTG